MKKILFFIFIIFAFGTTPNFFITAKAQSSPIYAKVVYQNVYFYSLPENENANKMFTLPQSYFVKLLANEGEEFYYAQYADVFGYVLKNSITPMSGTPSHPFATTSFRVFSMEGLGLYKKPNMSEEKLASIPYLSEDLIYYGTLQGQEVIPEKSSQWFFAKYATTSSFGYVYSVFCDKLPQPTENKETFEIIDSPLFLSDNAGEELSSVAMTFIIIGVSLPCLIVLYLLIKPTIAKEKIIKPQTKLKAKRNRDYFEFDESDLN